MEIMHTKFAENEKKNPSFVVMERKNASIELSNFDFANFHLGPFHFVVHSIASTHRGRVKGCLLGAQARKVRSHTLRRRRRGGSRVWRAVHRERGRG